MEFWTDGFYDNRKGLGLLQKTRNGKLIVATDTLNTGLPIYIYGEQPNPWSVPKFTKIGYDPACLTGSGATTLAIEMQSDLVNWRFAGAGQVLYSNSGTVAAPLVTGVAGAGGSTESNMWGSLKPMMIPAFMNYEGARYRFRCTLQKTGAVGAASIVIRFGRQIPGGSITDNDKVFEVAGAITNVTGRQYQVDVEFKVTSQGVSASAAAGTGERDIATFITKNYMTPNAGGTSAVADKGLYFSTKDINYFNINVIGSVGDTFSMIEYSLQALPL